MRTAIKFGYSKAETTSSQTSFFEDEPNFGDEAARRYPFSAKRGRIRGTGRYALVLRCSVPWAVRCYQNAEERQASFVEMQYGKCSALNCVHDHSTVDL